MSAAARKSAKTEDATEATTADAAVAETAACSEGRDACLDTSIRNHMLGAMAVCLIPAPAFDLAAVTAIQVKLVHRISVAYDVPFKKSAVKSILTSLVGNLGVGALAAGIFGSLTKFIPVVGHTVSAFTMPVVIGATTYAIGRVFVAHFETGGTLLDLDTEKMREHFQKEYDAGLTVAKEAKSSKKDAA